MSSSRLRITLLLTLLIVIGGLVLVILLALGLADPPLAGPLRWQASSIADWPVNQGGGFSIYVAPVKLEPPFTLELSALNSGAADSAWGLQLYGGPTLLISNEGYFSSASIQAPQWQEFPHIRPREINRITLHVNAEGEGIIRINDEIVLDKVAVYYVPREWAIATYHTPQLIWEQITLYHSSTSQ